MIDIRPCFYLCRLDHLNDRVYVENILEFFQESGIYTRVIELGRDGQRPELLECTGEDSIGVLGFNAQLDHSYVHSSPFLDLAERLKVPVVQWIMDHPSTRYHELGNSTPTNSRFLFMSEFSRQYFHRHVNPDALTAVTVGIGANRLSRIDEMSPSSFRGREVNCLIPLLLTRIGGSLEQIEARISTLDTQAGAVVRAAIQSALYDLDHPIELHFLAALNKTRRELDSPTFNACIQMVEEVVQVKRRTEIFNVARDFPVLIQSDIASRQWPAGAIGTLEENVDMRITLQRMQQSRAVLSVSHVNDEIHDRTLNGLNAGCVNIVEDNVAHRRLFRHGENAMLFRYGDGSLRECLELVCNDPDRAYAIAQAGFGLRDDPSFRFGGFHNILKLVGQPVPASAGSRGR